MRIIKESENGEYAVVLLGGSIGEKRISSLKHLTNEKAKRMNKLLSPGEKKYYGLKYVVAEVENGKYTGR